MTNGSPINCAQKEVQRTGRATLTELDEEGYYSSEPEAEETEWGSGDEGGSTDSVSSVGSEGSCDSYERNMIGRDTRSEEQKLDDKVEEIRLWLNDSTEDLRNMLEVFRIAGGYIPVISNSPVFSVSILESLLKLAKKYNQPHIREYAIKQLSGLPLAPAQRFRIARDHNLLEWEARATEQLCTRDDPITEEEAAVLGFRAFSEIAAKREKRQYRRGIRDAMSRI